jgi:Flp pilus assembly protein TadG
MVEVAISLTVFITLVLGMVDLGYGVFRQHVLTHAARQLARQAVVRGSMADRMNAWGPQPIKMTADQGHEAVSAISDALVGWDRSEVEVSVEWLDGGNDVTRQHRVQVALSAPYRPLMTFLFGNPAITLEASSTMAVAH